VGFWLLVVDHGLTGHEVIAEGGSGVGNRLEDLREDLVSANLPSTPAGQTPPRLLRAGHPW